MAKLAKAALDFTVLTFTQKYGLDFSHQAPTDELFQATIQQKQAKISSFDYYNDIVINQVK